MSKMEQYGHIQITKTALPLLNKGYITLFNNETGREVWRFECDGMDTLNEVSREIDTNFKCSSCPTCLANRIGTTLDVNDEVRSKMRVMKGE